MLGLNFWCGKTVGGKKKIRTRVEPGPFPMSLNQSPTQTFSQIQKHFHSRFYVTPLINICPPICIIWNESSHMVNPCLVSLLKEPMGMEESFAIGDSASKLYWLIIKDILNEIFPWPIPGVSILCCQPCPLKIRGWWWYFLGLTVHLLCETILLS